MPLYIGARKQKEEPVSLIPAMLIIHMYYVEGLVSGRNLVDELSRKSFMVPQFFLEGVGCVYHVMTG